MSPSGWRSWIACQTLLLLTALAGPAQDRAGALSGVVREGSGRVVQGAEVQLRSTLTGVERWAVTDASGAYRFPSLEPGLYEVAAQSQGFKRNLQRDLVVELDRETAVSHVLEIGDRQESVIVVGEARLLEVNSSVISTLVDRGAIQGLPLNGRDFIQLASLQAAAPGARAQARNVNTGYGVQISVAGSRPSQNSFRLDGINLNGYSGSTPASINGVNLGVEAIQEFSVLSSAYSAEYGRAAGGIVNAITRSGGNERHGSLFYYHRNDNLDARNFFDQDAPPEFRRHQFGAALGGPLARNRTFYFANYEGLRDARSTTTINTTLSQNARKGILTGRTVVVDPVMASVAELYPLPNGEVFGDTGLYVFQNSAVGNEDYITFRLDHSLRDSDKLFLRYSADDGDRSADTDFGLGREGSGTRSQSLVAEASHAVSPAALNTVRLGVLRDLTAFGQTSMTARGLNDPAYAFVPGGQSMGIIDVTGLSVFPGGNGSIEYGKYAFNSIQVSNDVGWLAGGHSFRLGVRVERTHLNMNNPSRPNGEYRFRGIPQFLTNVPDRFRAMVPGTDPVRGFRQWIAAGYVQDSWKVTSHLTMDLGLRYEMASVPSEVNGKVANLDALTDTQMRLGSPLFDNPSLRNAEPRIGFAWNLKGDGSTLVRGGYGVFPELVLSQYLLLVGVRNPPFFLRGSTRNLKPGDFPGNGFQVFLKDPGAELRVERIPRNLSQPYVQQWNLNMEQELGATTSLRLAYTGSHGLNLSSITSDANLVEPNVLADGRLFFPLNAQRINSVYSQIRNRTFDAHSKYHGIQAQARRRLSQGLQGQVSYSFSKSIDDSSSYFSSLESDNAAMMPFNGSPRFNRGLSAHDVRHRFVLAGSWELPSPGGGALERILGDWELGCIAAYASGSPFSARLGYDAARTQTSTADYTSGQRPDLAPGASNNPVTGDPRRWVDLAAFRRPEAGFLGNLGRGTIIGPDLANVDFSVSRNIRWPFRGEDTGLEFRAEFFNAFNRANFDLPAPERMAVFDATSTREDAGRITSAGPSREIQFGLRLRF